MARPQLPYFFLVADLKEILELVDSQAQIEELAHVREPYYHSNCIQGTLSMSAFHDADHLWKMRGMRKVNPNIK